MKRTTILLAALAALMLIPAASAFANGTMTVSFTGEEGGGEISSVGGPYEGTPAIECSYEGLTEETSGTCSNEMAELEPGVEGDWLYAYPESGYEAHWQVTEGTPFAYCGGAGNNAECLAGNFGGNAHVTVEFVPAVAKYLLTVTKTGTGTGTVSALVPPATIGCGSNCSHEYEEGTEVVLQASPASESTFTGWTGCDSEPVVEEKTRCKVTMTEAKNVSAEFIVTPKFPLTLHINGGEGTVVSSPAGITCTGSSGKECTAEFNEGTEVTLTASAAAGYRFWYWESCPSPEGHHCKVTMSEAKEVGVQFLADHAVSVSKSAGSEPGLVLLYPAPNGVGCDYLCSQASYRFAQGESVTLAAYEYPGNHLHLKEFTGGTGAASVCNGETECSFEVGSEDTAVEATFVKDAQNTLTIDKAGGGLAFLKSANGVYCSDYCSGSSADYYSGEEVEVTWKLAAGTSSIEWTTGAGTCTGSSSEEEGSCSVTMSAAKELVAKLE